MNQEGQGEDETDPLVIGNARCAWDIDGNEENEHKDVEKEFELSEAEFFIGILHKKTFYIPTGWG